MISKIGKYLGIVIIGIIFFTLVFNGITPKGMNQMEAMNNYYEDNHDSTGAWYGPLRAYSSDVYTVNDYLFLSDASLYYDRLNHEMLSFCCKPNCTHADIGCINNTKWTHVYYDKGEYYALTLENRYSIFRIRKSEAEEIYRSENQIINMWLYNNYIYYSTEYELMRYSIADKQVKCILKRPISLYLYFYNNKMIYEDDSFHIFEADIDGANEKMLTEQLANMLEVTENAIYYRNGENQKVYQLNKDGTSELIIDAPCYRYLITPEGFFYIADYSDETGGALKLLDQQGNDHKLLDTVYDFKYADENGLFLSRMRERTKEEIESGTIQNCFTAMYYWEREEGKEYFIQNE